MSRRYRAITTNTPASLDARMKNARALLEATGVAFNSEEEFHLTLWATGLAVADDQIQRSKMIESPGIVTAEGRPWSKSPSEESPWLRDPKPAGQTYRPQSASIQT